MRLLHFLSKELLYAGLSKEAFRQVKKPVGESNQKLLVALSISVALFWVMSLMVYRSIPYAHILTMLAVALSLSIFTLACGLFLVRRATWTLYPAIYLLSCLFWGPGSAWPFFSRISVLPPRSPLPP
jgi:hypothetical protein